jgi:hypothetical protein
MKTYKILYLRGDIFYVRAENIKKAFHKLWEKNPEFQYADILDSRLSDSSFPEEIHHIK